MGPGVSLLLCVESHKHTVCCVSFQGVKGYPGRRGPSGGRGPVYKSLDVREFRYYYNCLFVVQNAAGPGGYQGPPGPSGPMVCSICDVSLPGFLFHDL